MVAVVMLVLLGCSLGLSYAAIQRPAARVVVDGLGVSLPYGWLPPPTATRTNLGNTVRFSDPLGTARSVRITRFTVDRPAGAPPAAIRDVLGLVYARVLVGSVLRVDAPVEAGGDNAGEADAVRWVAWTGVRQQRLGRAVGAAELWSIAVLTPASSDGEQPYWAVVVQDVPSTGELADRVSAQHAWLLSILNSAKPTQTP